MADNTLLEIDRIYSTALTLQRYSTTTIAYLYHLDAMKHYYKCIKDFKLFNNQDKTFDDIRSRIIFNASMTLHLIISSNINFIVKLNDSSLSLKCKKIREKLRQPSEYASFEELEDYVYESSSYKSLFLKYQ